MKCREDYDDWNEKDVCLLVEQLAFGTVGHLFGTIVPTEKNLASAMARSRKMKMVPFRWWVMLTQRATASTRVFCLVLLFSDAYLK